MLSLDDEENVQLEEGEEQEEDEDEDEEEDEDEDEDDEYDYAESRVEGYALGDEPEGFALGVCVCFCVSVCVSVLHTQHAQRSNALHRQHTQGHTLRSFPQVNAHSTSPPPLPFPSDSALNPPPLQTPTQPCTHAQKKQNTPRGGIRR